MIKPLYLSGEFLRTEYTREIRSPWNNELIATISMAGPGDIEKAIIAARSALKQTRDLGIFERVAVLRHVADRLKQKREEFAKLLAQESAKPLKYALSEVDRASDTFLIAAEECKRLTGEFMRLDWTPAGKGKTGIVHYFPAGVVAGITPFNFPFNLVAHKVAPAIATGCPIILKPASSTPLSALALAEIIHETKLPKGAFSVLPCDRKTGDMLVTDNRIAVLSFTGSPEIGWDMKARAGRKKVVLELGGNAGVYIADDADVDHAVERCLVGAFAYSGQICIHAQRIFVDYKIFEEFIGKFITRAEMLKTGDPLQKETEPSTMIDEGNALRVESWMNEAIQKGAKLLCGGNRKGGFFEATILTGTDATMKVFAEEVFGPIVVVEKVNSRDEGIRQLNNTRFGLQAGIFTNDFQFIQKAFREIEVGGVIVNDVPTFRVDHMPYGGVKDSGLGREGVKYAMMDFIEPRILVQ
jgi:glyceraldehyde-3-phosphate dehydrogenase (NADP+)